MNTERFYLNSALPAYNNSIKEQQYVNLYPLVLDSYVFFFHTLSYLRLLSQVVCVQYVELKGIIEKKRKN